MVVGMTLFHGSLATSDFILVVVIINHVILCGVIVDINFFNCDCWNHVILGSDLTNFDFDLVVVIINSVILCKFIAYINFIFELWSL